MMATQHISIAYMPEQTFKDELKHIVDTLRHSNIAELAILYTTKDKAVPIIVTLFVEIQQFRADYINSLMLLDRNIFQGVGAFNTTKQIGHQSAYGVINIGDYGSSNVQHVIKTNGAHDLAGVELEFLLGVKYFNLFRKEAPYWMYTYSAKYCNNLLENPQGNNSHMWCHYHSHNLQIVLEKVEGISYRQFLMQVDDPDRQVAVLARILDAVGYMWNQYVTHGDLHAMNIHVLTFGTSLAIPCLTTPTCYLTGIDVPVILDYGSSSVMTPDGLLVNTRVRHSHNPHHDLHKLMQWVISKGQRLKSNLEYNSFGIYVQHIMDLLQLVDTSESVIPEATPFIPHIFPAAVVQDLNNTGDYIVIDNNNSRWVETYIKLAMMTPRGSMATPQQATNALVLAKEIPDKYSRNTQHAWDRALRFNSIKYSQWLSTRASHMAGQTEELERMSKVLDMAFNDTEENKSTSYNTMSQNVFSQMTLMFTLVNGMYSLKKYLDTQPRNPHVTQSLSNLIDISKEFSLAQFRKTLELLRIMLRQWQGMNYMTVKVNEHFAGSQRPTAIMTMDAIEMYVNMWETLSGTSATSPAEAMIS